MVGSELNRTEGKRGEKLGETPLILNRLHISRKPRNRHCRWGNSEVTQQDGRGKKTAKLVVIILFEKTCLKPHLPLNRPFCKRPKNTDIQWRSLQNMQVIARSRLSHKCFACVLLFLSSCCVNSLLIQKNRRLLPAWGNWCVLTFLTFYRVFVCFVGLAVKKIQMAMRWDRWPRVTYNSLKTKVDKKPNNAARRWL